jgi:hypothetical protein
VFAILDGEGEGIKRKVLQPLQHFAGGGRRVKILTLLQAKLS